MALGSWNGMQRRRGAQFNIIEWTPEQKAKIQEVNQVLKEKCFLPKDFSESYKRILNQYEECYKIISKFQTHSNHRDRGYRNLTNLSNFDDMVTTYPHLRRIVELILNRLRISHASSFISTSRIKCVKRNVVLSYIFSKIEEYKIILKQSNIDFSTTHKSTRTVKSISKEFITFLESNEWVYVNDEFLENIGCSLRVMYKWSQEKRFTPLKKRMIDCKDFLRFIKANPRRFILPKEGE